MFKLKKFFSCLTAFLILLLCAESAICSAQSEINFFVAPYGSDENAGTLEAPFKTVNKAKEAVSGYISSYGNPDGGITVYIREGIYEMNEALTFSAADGGTENSPVIYSAYNNETVRLTGGKKIDASKFTVVTDGEILNKLPVEVRGKIYSLNLAEQGITDYGNLKPVGTYQEPASHAGELLINGKKKTLARYPNSGFMRSGEITDAGSPYGDGAQRKTDARGASFKYSDDRISRWKNAADAYLFGYWQFGWATDAVRIKSIDTENKIIELKDAAVYKVLEDRLFYAFNLLEELDVPGEYYIDRDKHILYYYPEENEDLYKDDVMISGLEKAMVSGTVDNIEFKDIIFECSRGGGMRLVGNNITIDGCKVRCMGTDGVRLNGFNNKVINSDIYDIGTMCLLISGGTASGNTYDPGNNLVENCEIYNYGTLTGTSNGILIRSPGSVLTKNRIHGGNHSAISFGGIGIKITYNEIYDVLRVGEDAGAIYGGRSLTECRGVEIAYNYLHDLTGIDDLRNGLFAGVYLDDELSGVSVHHNMFYNVSSPIMGNGGSQCKVYNNMMVNVPVSSSGAIYWSDRWMGWENKTEEEQWKALNRPGESQKRIYDSLSKIDFKSEPYASMFPELNEYSISNFCKPFGNVVENNIMINHREVTLRGSFLDMSVYRNNYVSDEDPGFVDYENRDFRLKPDSVIYSKVPEWEEIPFSEIGIYDNGRRTVTPVDKAPDSFRLVAPLNNAVNVTADNVVFQWNPCHELGVKYYILTIAEDENFENIVYNSEVRGYEDTVELLELNKKFFWRVTAVTKDGKEFLNSDGVNNFTTTYYSSYKRALDYDGTLINATKREVTPPKITDITEILADFENWDQGGTYKMTAEKDGINFKNSGSAVGGYRGRKIEENEILHFGIKFNNASFVGFGLPSSSTSKLFWEGSAANIHYLVLVKPDGTMECQKVDGYKGSVMMGTTKSEKTYNDGKTHDVLFGTYDVANSKYVLFAIDGEVIFNIKDTWGEGPIKGDGWFSVYIADSSATSMGFTITNPIADIPEISYKYSDLPSKYTESLTGATVVSTDSANAYYDLILTKLDKRNSRIKAELVNGTLMLPYDFLANSLGAEAELTENGVTFTKDGKAISMKLDSSIISLNGDEKECTAPIKKINGEIYVPVRIISEFLNYRVIYKDEVTMIVPENNPIEPLDDTELAEIFATTVKTGEFNGEEADTHQIPVN